MLGKFKSEERNLIKFIGFHNATVIVHNLICTLVIGNTVTLTKTLVLLPKDGMTVHEWASMHAPICMY